MVKPEKFCHFHLVYHFTVPLMALQAIFLQFKVLTLFLQSALFLLSLCFDLKQVCQSRVQIIASDFRNCKVNCSYCDCKFVNHTKKNEKLFFPKESLIHPHQIFSHYIHILFMHCILLSKKYCLYIKPHCKMKKLLCNS